MLKRLLALTLISLPALIFARKTLEYGVVADESGPWLTGPLVTPSGHVIPFGHQNYEPYITWQQIKGLYNNHWRPVKTPVYTCVQSQTVLQFGIAPATEFNILPTFEYNHFMHKHKWCYADMPVSIGFQLLMDEPDEWWPAIKLRVSANIPLGKYNRLDPKKVGTDFSGIGTWYPGLSLVFSRLFDFCNFHFLTWRLCVGYEFGTPVNVHGMSAYRGAPTVDGIKGTRGRVYPGDVFYVETGLEYSLTHHWAVAMDIVYEHVNRTPFKGYTPPGSVVGYPSTEQLSVAPAIEYNFNANIGIIVGPEFSVTGRNTNFTFNYITWMFAINIYN